MRTGQEYKRNRRDYWNDYYCIISKLIQNSKQREYYVHFIILPHSTTILYVNLILKFLIVHRFMKNSSAVPFVSIFLSHNFTICSVVAPYVLRLLIAVIFSVVAPYVLRLLMAQLPDQVERKRSA